MKLRLGAAVLLAAITPLTAVTTPSPARAGVDITPPEVGSCHDLTYEEGLKFADPDPAVDCTARHTAVTTKVIVFEEAPGWDDKAALVKRVSPICRRATLDFFSGAAKALQLSNYTTWFFGPTKAQQDAGANWVRCDVALYTAGMLKRLPTDGPPHLGQPPLDDYVARCRKGQSADFAVVTCDRPHHYHATHGFKYPGDTYPGLRRMVRWTIRRCSNAIGGPFYYEAALRAEWRVGMRYSICLTKTRN